MMRYNPATGQMEDDGLPEGTVQVDLPTDIPAQVTGLGPGEFVASGSAMRGKALTNAPEKLAAVTPGGIQTSEDPELAKAQAEVAKVQAQVVRKQNEAVMMQQAGAPGPDRIAETNKIATRNMLPQAAPGTPSPYRPVEKTIQQKASEHFNAVWFGNTGTLLSPDDRDYQSVMAQLKKEGRLGAVKEKEDRARAGIIKTIEDMKAGAANEYMSRDQWNAAVSGSLEASGIPAAYKKWALDYARKNAPASVQMLEASDVNVEAKRKELQMAGDVQRQQKMTQFDENVKKAREMNQQEVVEWGVAHGLNKDAFAKFASTGDVSGLKPEVAKLYQDTIDAFKDSRSQEWIGDDGGIRKRDISADERSARRIERQAQAKGGFFTSSPGEGTGSLLISPAVKKNPEALASVESAISMFKASAKYIGLSDQAANRITALSGITPKFWGEYADNSLGVKPGTEFSKRVTGITGDIAANDAKEAYKVMSGLVDSGVDLSSDSAKQKLSSVISGEKDSDRSRMRLSLALSTASSMLQKESFDAMKTKMDEAKKYHLDEATRAGLNVLNEVATQSPAQQYATMQALVQAAVPRAGALGELGVKAPGTEAERQDIVSRPSLFVAALLKNSEDMYKNNPHALALLRESMQDGMNEATYQRWAQENPGMARIAEDLSKQFVASTQVVEDKVRSYVDSMDGVGKQKAFDTILNSGGAWSLRKAGDPSTAIMFSRREYKDVYDSLPEDQKENFLSLLPKPLRGLYGNGSPYPDQPGVSDVAAKTLAAIIRNDQAWEQKQGFRSQSAGGGDVIVDINNAIQKQITPVASDKGKRAELPPAQFPPSILSNPENVVAISSNTDLLWRIGYSLATDKSSEHIALGKSYMEAAAKAGIVEERGMLVQRVVSAGTILRGNMAGLMTTIGIPVQGVKSGGIAEPSIMRDIDAIDRYIKSVDLRENPASLNHKIAQQLAFTDLFVSDLKKTVENLRASARKTPTEQASTIINTYSDAISKITSVQREWRKKIQAEQNIFVLKEIPVGKG